MSNTQKTNEPLMAIDWVLVYGTARTGTSYMSRMVSRACRRYIGDWGLQNLLVAVTDNRNANYDVHQMLVDIANNLLANASIKNGTQIDLVYKQADISFKEYAVLERIWGKPTKKIYCYRRPDEYLCSAVKKFPHISISQLQKGYENQMIKFDRIGGELFEYHERLSIKNYIEFLSPIDVGSENEPFIYKGERDKLRVTSEMWAVYEELSAKHKL